MLIWWVAKSSKRQVWIVSDRLESEVFASSADPSLLMFMGIPDQPMFVDMTSEKNFLREQWQDNSKVSLTPFAGRHFASL